MSRPPQGHDTDVFHHRHALPLGNPNTGGTLVSVVHTWCTNLGVSWTFFPGVCLFRNYNPQFLDFATSRLSACHLIINHASGTETTVLQARDRHTRSLSLAAAAAAGGAQKYVGPSTFRT